MISKENIKCNGISFAPELSESLTESLLTSIAERKKGGFIPPDKEWFMKGRRYHDDNRILQVIVCNAVKLIPEKQLEEYFLDISEEHLNAWIDSALSYSGSADYYYTYEKEWD